MKVLKIFGIGLAVIIVLVVGISFFLPKTYHVERTVSVDAPPAQVHRLTSDLQNGWPQWEPWGEADDTIVTTYGEITAGVGAYQSWSNKDGAGSLTLTMCDVAVGVEYDMAFNVDQYISKGKLSYTSTATGTDVTWEMDGDVNDLPTGEEPGDRALVEVAHTVRSILRAKDTCVRATSGQLMAVLPGLDADTSGSLVTRVRHALESLALVTWSGDEIRLAVQVGRACVPQDGTDLDALLVAAREDVQRSRLPQGGSALERISRAAPIIPN